MTYYKANMCLTSNDIQHFGVPGMKWGVRKAPLTKSTIDSRLRVKLRAQESGNKKAYKDINYTKYQRAVRVNRKSQVSLLATSIAKGFLDNNISTIDHQNLRNAVNSANAAMKTVNSVSWAIEGYRKGDSGGKVALKAIFGGGGTEFVGNTIGSMAAMVTNKMYLDRAFGM